MTQPGQIPVSTSLPGAVAQSSGPDTGLRVGQVTSANPFTVTVSGTALSMSGLTSYLPQVGDTVAIIRTNDTWLCLGRISSTLAAPAWTAATLQNGWTNRPGYAVASYRLLTPYLLQLQLNIVPGTRTDGTILFGLPANCVPLHTASWVANGGSVPAVNLEYDTIAAVHCYGAASASFIQTSQILPLDL